MNRKKKEPEGFELIEVKPTNRRVMPEAVYPIVITMLYLFLLWMCQYMLDNLQHLNPCTHY